LLKQSYFINLQTLKSTADENRECCLYKTIKKNTMENLIKFVQDEFVTRKDFPDFAAGDTVTVYYEIKEGEKTRTQFFKGVVIQRKGSGSSETFTIRKISGTVGVERIFPVNLPALQKIEVNKKGKVRRARIYYFRELTGKKARIKEVRRK
jgi:large subunit ribosomal protein L19